MYKYILSDNKGFTCSMITLFQKGEGLRTVSLFECYYRSYSHYYDSLFFSSLFFRRSRHLAICFCGSLQYRNEFMSIVYDGEITGWRKTEIVYGSLPSSSFFFCYTFFSFKSSSELDRPISIYIKHVSIIQSTKYTPLKNSLHGVTFFFVSCSYIILLVAKCRKKCSYEISRSSLVTFRLFHSHTSSVHSRSFTHARASRRVSQYFLFSFFPFFLPFILSLFLELFISTVSFMDFQFSRIRIFLVPHLSHAYILSRSLACSLSKSSRSFQQRQQVSRTNVSTSNIHLIFSIITGTRMLGERVMNAFITIDH